MTEAAKKAREIATKHQDRVGRLRKEIAARKASRRGAKALAKAEAALPRAERLAAVAAERAAALEANAKRRAIKRARIAAEVAPMLRRLDKVAEAAPAVMEKWKADRKEEPKRLSKRQRQLIRAVTADRQPDQSKQMRRAPSGELRPDPRRRREVAPPMVEAETWPSGPIIPHVPSAIELKLDRPGLEVGDYRIIERSHRAEASTTPDRWTAHYVGRRLGEAHATLRRLPMKTRPAEFGSAMPEYVHEGVELAYQAGAGTLFQNRGRSRQILGTGANEVARMNEALGWPLEFLSKHPAHAFSVNEWAFWRDLDEDEAAAVFGLLTQQALEFIAAKLNAKGRPVT